MLFKEAVLVCPKPIDIYHSTPQPPGVKFVNKYAVMPTDYVTQHFWAASTT